jgi:hypothetical protein
VDTPGHADFGGEGGTCPEDGRRCHSSCRCLSRARCRRHAL